MQRNKNEPKENTQRHVQQHKPTAVTRIKHVVINHVRLKNLFSTVTHEIQETCFYLNYLCTA